MKRERALRGAEVVGIAISAIAAVAHALSLAWVCDDAYVCFRYADNLLAGHGLVFNPGERVEGYTNFLWTLWIAAGRALGASPEAWTIAWGATAFGATVLLIGLAAARHGRALGLPAFAPLAALLAAASRDLAVHATSGLETSAFGFLLVAGFVLATADRASTLRPAAAGAVFGLAVLTRPDGAVPAACAAAWLLWTRREAGAGPAVRHALAFAAGAAVLVVPHLAWRVLYYGDWVPNTYFAKSADRLWIDQGLFYAGLYFGRWWPLLLAVPAPLLARRVAPVALATLIGAAYSLHVIRFGGDFMHARMLVPATPFLLLGLDAGVRALAARGRVAGWLAAATVATAWALQPSALSGPVEVRGVTDEWEHYSPDRTDWADRSRRNGATLARLFDGLPVRVAFFGGEAALVWHARPEVAIECETGLTDREIARRPLAERGRIGHEKHAAPAYVIGTRGAIFAFHPNAGMVLGLPDAGPDEWADLGGVPARILSRNEPLFEELRRRGARIPGPSRPVP